MKGRINQKFKVNIVYLNLIEKSVVHVRNLSTKTDEKKLMEKLEKYGNISKIEIIRERATGYQLY